MNRKLHLSRKICFGIFIFAGLLLSSFSAFSQTLDYQLDNYEEGFKTLSLFPEIYKLNENEQIEHRNYVSLFTFKSKIRESCRTIAQLKEDEVEQLVNFAFASHGLSSVMARGILCFFYDICLEEEGEGSDEKGKSIEDKINPHKSVQPVSSVYQAAPENITLYPNPTTGELTITSTE